MADRGGRGRVLPAPGRDGFPLRLPGEQDPNPMATCEPRLMAAAVESPLPGDWHGGFGERSGETGRWQHRNRAPGRLSGCRLVAFRLGQVLAAVAAWTASLRS